LLGQAKIENLRAVVARDEDVVGLQVAMDDSLFVRGRKSFGDFQGVLGGLRRRK
jgi:hypothetical protein